MLIYIAAILFLIYLAFGLTLYFTQPMMLYTPSRDVLYNPGDMSMEFEDVTFEADDGVKLTGWYTPADNAEYTILFCHANAGNLAHRLDTLNTFNSMGISTFIFDYRGYGNSGGRPTEKGTYFDAMAAWRWLTQEKNVDPETVIIFGRSLGGSIATNLAAKVQANSLVIESSFTSYADVGAKYYPYLPVKRFSRFKYKTIDYLRQVHCPVMIIHSRDDEVIPFEFGLKLYEAASEPKKFAEICGRHNNGFTLFSPMYKEKWNQWIDFLSLIKQSQTAED